MHSAQLAGWLVKSLLVMHLACTQWVLAASPRRTSISCYECSSRNHSNSLCHDPVHPAGVELKERCKVPRKNHVGYFPAGYCIKMKGKSRRTQEEIVVRSCALESMDNSCGIFKYEDELFEGCILTCTYDGCNHSQPSVSLSMRTLLLTNCLLLAHFVSFFNFAY